MFGGDEAPSLKRGKICNLARRNATTSQSSSSHENGSNINNSRIIFLHQPLSNATTTSSAETDNVVNMTHSDDNDENNNEGKVAVEETMLFSVRKGYAALTNDDDNAADTFVKRRGDIFVTSKRLLFACEEEPIEVNMTEEEELRENPHPVYYSKFDFAIDINFVVLHALARDPEPCVYCQLDQRADNDEEDRQKVPTIVEASEGNDQCDDGGEEAATNGDDAAYVPTEVYLFPSKCNDDGESFNGSTTQSNEKQEALLNQLFHALSTAAELNPDDDDEDEGDGGLGYMFGGGGGDSNEAFFSLGNGVSTAVMDDGRDSDAGATEEERAAALNRLDDMLVVPPHLEVNENGGQFDDADEDDDLL